MKKILKYITIAIIAIYSFSSQAKELAIPLHASKISLNPSEIQDKSSLFVSRQVNCQLIREQGSTFSLEAAESINFNSPTQIIISLNKKYKFHDGSSITTEDVIASFELIKKSRNTLRNIFDWIEEIKPLNKHTLVFKLKKPIPQFIKVFSSPNYAIFKKSFLQNAEKNKILWNNPLGCGKYKINNLSENFIRLTPIEKGYPIVFYLIKSNQLAPKDLEKFDISDLYISESMNPSNKFSIVEIFDPTQIYIGLNTTKEKWKNKLDRCDFLSKIDRNEILKQYDASAKLADDYFPQGILGYSSPSQYMKITTKNRSTRTNSIPIKNPFYLSFLKLSIPSKLQSAYEKSIQNIYSFIQTTELDTAKTFGPDFLKSNADALIIGLKSNYLDGYEYLLVFSEENANYTGYRNQALSQKIKDSQNILDPAARAAQYREILSKIQNLCLTQPLITITTHKVYIKNSLTTPEIGKGPLNEYDLSNVI